MQFCRSQLRCFFRLARRFDRFRRKSTIDWNHRVIVIPVMIQWFNRYCFPVSCVGLWIRLLNNFLPSRSAESLMILVKWRNFRDLTGKVGLRCVLWSRCLACGWIGSDSILTANAVAGGEIHRYTFWNRVTCARFRGVFCVMQCQNVKLIQ